MSETSSKTFDLLVRGGRCVTPGGVVDADVGIRGGRIAAIGALGAASAAEEIDASGLHVLPGLIDTQVHFREPGLEYKEDLGTGTAGAALGGITAVFEMPNTKPSTLTHDDLADKVARGRAKGWTDFAFFIGASAENVDQLGAIEQDEGCCGVKIFMGSSTGSLLVDDPEVLEQVLRKGRRRVAVHCEDEARMTERWPLTQVDGVTAHVHPVWRDEQTALIATTRLLEVARQAGRRVHVLHVTTASEMELLRHHKDIATVEVTPQHLTLHAPDCYDRLGTYAQMNPPVRGAEHKAALWRALNAGVVDVIGSDHAPHTRAEKDLPYPRSPSGMPGVQTTVPLMLDHVHHGRLSLLRVVDLLAHGPNRIYNIAGKGRLVLGYDGDLTLVDLAETREVTDDWIASRSGWSPFTGMRLTGWPVATIIRGRVVMRDGELLGAPGGQPVRFQDTLPAA
ncbi:MAG: dihydroorotase [Alphaproteobacteria bacterium]|nr:dihydroorotase [Alphaproteobacteria bacterium]